MEFLNAIGGVNSGFTPGWNGFQYQISRYSDETPNRNITLKAVDKYVTEYEFVGKSDNLTTGTIKSVTSSDENIAEGMVVRSGESAKKLLSNVGKLKDVDISKVSDKLQSLISSVVSSQYFGALAAGLKYMFG